MRYKSYSYYSIFVIKIFIVSLYFIIFFYIIILYNYFIGVFLSERSEFFINRSFRMIWRNRSDASLEFLPPSRLASSRSGSERRVDPSFGEESIQQYGIRGPEVVHFAF